MMSIWKVATLHQASRSHWKFVSPLCCGFLKANHPNPSILPSQKKMSCSHSSTEVHACCFIWICIYFFNYIWGDQTYELYFAYNSITLSPRSLTLSMSKRAGTGERGHWANPHPRQSFAAASANKYLCILVSPSWPPRAEISAFLIESVLI